MNTDGAGEKNVILLGVHSLCAGGTERVVTTLLRYFSGMANLKVHCVLYGRRPECFYSLPTEVDIHFPSFNFDNNSRVSSTAKTIGDIRKVVKKVKPTIFINFGERWNSLVLLSTIGLNVPIIVADRSNPEKSLGTLQDLLRRWLYPRSSGVVVQTEHAARVLSSILSGKVPLHVIPNPLFNQPQSISAVREKEILYVGRLIPSKHVDRLIDIFEHVWMEGWRLTIVGGDAQGFSEMKKLSNKVNSSHVKDHISLEGVQSDVTKHYMRASIFAFPSSSEGFPNALAEALSHGLPSVAYDCCAGPSDLIENGVNGFLVPLHEEREFQNCLIRIMESEELSNRMSKAASRSMQRLSVDLVAGQFLEACGLDRHVK